MRSRFAARRGRRPAAVGLALTGCSGSGGSSTSTGPATSTARARRSTSDRRQHPLPRPSSSSGSRDVSAQFKKQTGATVKFETFASANDELTKIQTSVLSGQGPDIYGLGTTFTPTAYSTGAFVKLTADDWNKVGGRDRFVPATLGISGPDQKHQVGIPFPSRPFVMAYNKDLLKAAAGIDKPAHTWDGLRRAGEEAHQRRRVRHGDRLRRRLRPVEVRLGDVACSRATRSST